MCCVLCALHAQALDSTQTYIVVGGEGCQMQIWNLSTQREVFRAKGGKPNRVGLVDPANVTAVTFIPEASTSGAEAGGGAQASSAQPQEGAQEGGDPPLPQQRVLVGTAKHKLYLYDPRVGKRPQLDVSWGEARVTALAAPEDGENECWGPGFLFPWFQGS